MKIYFYTTLLIFFLLFFSRVHAQTWLWGRSAQGDSYISGQEGISVCTDKNDNAFVFGTYVGAAVAIGADTFPTSGGTQVVLAKYDANGNYLWGRSSSGASAQAQAYCIACDDSGNVLITGKFTGSVNFGIYSLNASGNSSIFLVKYNANGNVVWAQSPGNNGQSEGHSVCADANGNIYLTGVFGNPSITFGNVTITTPYNSLGVFLAKFDGNGNALNATGAGGGAGNAVCLDRAGNIFLSGIYAGTSTIFGVYTLPSATYSDVFLVKYDPSFNALWAKTVAGYNYENDFSVAADSSGNVFIAGVFNSPFISFGAYSATNVNSATYDGFIAKYDSNGNFDWARVPDVLIDDYGFSVSADALGNVYFTGGMFSFSSTYPPLFFGADTLQAPYGSVDPMFIVKYDKYGTPLCASMLVSGGDDQNSVAVDIFGDVYIGGDIAHPTWVGPDSLPLVGSENLFLAKYRCPCDLHANVVGQTSICAGDTALLSVAGGVNYSWSTNSTGDSIFVSPSTTTTFSVVASYGACSDTTIIPFTVHSLPLLSISSQTTAVCLNDSSGTASVNALTGTFPFSFSWSPYGGNNSTATGLLPGSYFVSVTDSNGCTSQQQVLIDTFALPQAFARNDTTITLGGTAQLFSSGGISYEWSPSDGLNCTNCHDIIASPVSTTRYCVEVSDTNNCRASACVIVTVDECPVYIPNAFSPNHDGENDFLCVRSNCIGQMHFSVYDRWGEKVFETDNQSICWDGTYHGSELEAAVFTYELDATLIDGKKFIKAGNVSLVK